MAGFRVARRTSPSTNGLKRMRAYTYVPSAENMNLVSATNGSILYMFMNANSTNGAAIDVGIYKMGNQWYAFIQGDNGAIWEAPAISNQDGLDYYMTAYFDPTDGITLKIDGDEVLNYPIGQHWMVNELCQPATAMAHTGFEITLVPVGANWTNFNSTKYIDGDYVRAYFCGARYTNCLVRTYNGDASLNTTFIEADHDSSVNYDAVAKQCSHVIKDETVGFEVVRMDLNDTSVVFTS
jgi:hypothetical protein